MCLGIVCSKRPVCELGSWRRGCDAAPAVPDQESISAFINASVSAAAPILNLSVSRPSNLLLFMTTITTQLSGSRTQIVVQLICHTCRESTTKLMLPMDHDFRRVADCSVYS